MMTADTGWRHTTSERKLTAHAGWAGHAALRPNQDKTRLQRHPAQPSGMTPAFPRQTAP